MKALIYKKYGSPNNLKLVKLRKPIPKDNEVLINVYASSINSADLRMLRANPFFIRFMQGILKPKREILGLDIAGKVEAVGGNVTLFKPGDEVYGTSSLDVLGGYAEYVCLPEKAAIVLKPKNISFEQSAAVPVAAMTALQGLRKLGNIESGQKILINGASGGVGSFAVLIAKAYGAHVTGVCSTRNTDIISKLGADRIIDYKKEDFIKKADKYDYILDVVGNFKIRDYKKMLVKNGSCIVIGFTSVFNMISLMINEKFASKNETKKIGGLGAAISCKEDLKYLKELIEEGKIILVIDRVYPLEKAVDAMEYFENEHSRTKVVIDMINKD